MSSTKHQIKRAIYLSRKFSHVVKDRYSITNKYMFNIDSPRNLMQEKRLLEVEGWIISKSLGDFTLRVKNNDTIHIVEMGKKRTDVAKTLPLIPKEKALYSGFSSQFEFDDGLISIEIDNGKGFRKLYETTVTYSAELLPSNLYNKELSNNYPEHINLLQNRSKTFYEDGLSNSYKLHRDDPRLMAIYLPQFHPFKENDQAWGKGFTEWSNVSTGQPRFVGHQQPILPKDLGFYDLRLEDKIEEQINLAKKYGISGFCFYYYWFSGKKIMDTPLNSFLKNKDWDFNFSICWANENWTKRWDGRDNDVIIAQEYRDEDPVAFIKDVEHVLLDPRYVKEDGKPVLMVYRASELKRPELYVEAWRNYFRKKHNLELQLVSYLSFDDKDPREYGFDAALDFAPLSAFFKNHLFDNNQFPFIDVSQKLLDPNFSGVVADYRTIALNDKLSNAYDFPVYPCITPSWDNDARKKGKGFIFQNSSPDIYAQWLERIILQETAKKKAPLIFINAWNEWAEGAIMEPSNHIGHAVLNRTVEVLSRTSNNKINAELFPAYNIPASRDKRLAVVVHLYYVDLWPDIEERLNLISESFDLFVTLNERDKDFEPTLANSNNAITTFILPNRGRDVLPFLYVARRLRAAGYKIVLKIHSKKSKHRKDGSSWFNEVIDSLLPNPEVIKTCLDKLETPSNGIVGPQNHLVSLKRHMGSNRHILEHLLNRAYDEKVSKKIFDAPENYPYFGGTMFWCRLDAIDPLLDLHLLPDDFQSEHGQVDGTTAHAIERFIGIIIKLQERKIYSIYANGVDIMQTNNVIEKYTYAP